MSQANEPSENATVPSLLYAIKQVEQVVRARLDEILRPYKVTALQYTALTVLEQRDGRSSAELARNAFVKPQSMADMVSSLEGMGLVVRRKDDIDRKRLNVTLTPAGRSLLQECWAEVHALEERMLSDLTDHQVKQLGRSLNSCRRSLS